MRIVKSRVDVVGTPWRNFVVVELETDEGLTGVGETRPVNHPDAVVGYLEHVLRAHVQDRDPFAIEALVQNVLRTDYGRPGEIAMSALATVEMACWDIVGKAAGQPVYNLLGGRVRESVKAYANGWYDVDRTPDAFHAAASEVVERGYRALKLDPFGTGLAEIEAAERRRALELVEAVRDAIGTDCELMIEMHGRFTPAAAIRLARELLPFEPAWIEEPVPPENVKALAKVAAGSEVSVATGERLHTRYDFRELLELQAADILQPDVAQFGGLLEARKLAATAEISYVLVAPHNVGGPIATAAALHLGACTPNFKVLEHFNDFCDTWLAEAFPGLPSVGADGHFPIPDSPGLGVSIDWDLVAEHPRENIHLDLFADGWHRRDARVAR